MKRSKQTKPSKITRATSPHELLDTIETPDEMSLRFASALGVTSENFPADVQESIESYTQKYFSLHTGAVAASLQREVDGVEPATSTVAVAPAPSTPFDGTAELRSRIEELMKETAEYVRRSDPRGLICCSLGAEDDETRAGYLTTAKGMYELKQISDGYFATLRELEEYNDNHAM